MRPQVRKSISPVMPRVALKGTWQQCYPLVKPQCAHHPCCMWTGQSLLLRFSRMRSSLVLSRFFCTSRVDFSKISHPGPFLPRTLSGEIKQSSESPCVLWKYSTSLMHFLSRCIKFTFCEYRSHFLSIILSPTFVLSSVGSKALPPDCWPEDPSPCLAIPRQQYHLVLVTFSSNTEKPDARCNPPVCYIL